MARNGSGVYSLPDTIENGDSGDATQLMSILSDMETDHNDMFSLDFDNTSTGDNTFSGINTFSGTLSVTGTFSVNDLTVNFLAIESGLTRFVTDNGLAGALIRAGSVYDTGDTRDEYTANEGAVTMQMDYEAATPAWYVRLAPTGTTNGAVTYETILTLDNAGNFNLQTDGLVELAFDALVGDFIDNDTVTGNTSLATATIRAVTGNTLKVDTVVGTFQDNETITGAIQGSATANIPGGVQPIGLDILHEGNFHDIISTTPVDTTWDQTTDYVMTSDGFKAQLDPKRQRVEHADSPWAATGTSKTFDNIPSWANKIEIAVTGLSTNGGNSLGLVVGDSTSLYSTAGDYDSGRFNSGGNASQTDKIASLRNSSAGDAHNGTLFLTKGADGQEWHISGVFGDGSDRVGAYSGRTVSALTSGVLTRFQIEGGGNTFDNGTIRVHYSE